MKQVLVIILALNLAITVTLQADPSPAGSYKDSCHNCTYTNGILTCQCCDSSADNGWGCKYCSDPDAGECRPQDTRTINRPTSVNQLPGITCSSYKNNNGKLGCEKASPDIIKKK